MTAIEVSIDINVSSRRKIERLFEDIFKRYPPAHKSFACPGASGNFRVLAAILCDKFGWSENDIGGAHQDQIALLLISIKDFISADIETLLSELGAPSLILLHCSIESKKQWLFKLMEDRGYRIYCEIDHYVYFYLFSSTARLVSDGLRLGGAEAKEILKTSWRRISKLSEDTELELISVAARELLVPRRFDIAIKAHYARLWLAGCAKSWREYAYYEHILRITGPAKTVQEYDGTGKEGLEHFLNTFHSLLGDLDPAEIPHVPVDAAHIAFDGAHRIAAAIAKGRNVNCARLHNPSSAVATADFFQGVSLGHSPCPIEILDEAAIEYCRIKDTAAVALVFPTVASEDAAIQQLSEIGEIVYRKDIVLSPEAGGGLLRQVYLGNSWLNDASLTSGFLHKQRSCFPFTGMLRVLLLDRFEPKDLRPVKETIRSAYGVGNHSIHITDSYEETLRTARTLFNQNSVKVLSLGIGNLPGFHEKLRALRDWVQINGIDENLLCVDGSAVLSVLGLRECRDVDFLYHGDPRGLPPLPKRVDCHNDQEKFHAHKIEDIVGDPRLHFWYMGIKFCTPELIRDMKRKRGESKDRVDVIMLQSILPSRYLQKIYTYQLGLIRISSYLLARLGGLERRIKAKIPRKLKDKIRETLNFIRSN